MLTGLPLAPDYENCRPLVQQPNTDAWHDGQMTLMVADDHRAH